MMKSTIIILCGWLSVVSAQEVSGTFRYVMEIRHPDTLTMNQTEFTVTKYYNTPSELANDSSIHKAFEMSQFSQDKFECQGISNTSTASKQSYYLYNGDKKIAVYLGIGREFNGTCHLTDDEKTESSSIWGSECIKTVHLGDSNYWVQYNLEKVDMTGVVLPVYSKIDQDNTDEDLSVGSYQGDVNFTCKSSET
ncbi:hypothetical protein N9Y17_04965 [Gammaproteobacteria bacterium]|nr:hypothetical protein [Gammaproteobacteria bacterium]